MILGTPFPVELETQLDAPKYREYLNKKSTELPTSYLSFIPPAAVMGALGYVVGKKTNSKYFTPKRGAAITALMPLGLMHALKQYDDKQILRANELKDQSDDVILEYLKGKQERIAERPASTKLIFDLQRSMSKTAGWKTNTALGLTASVLGGMYLKNKLNPKNGPSLSMPQKVALRKNTIQFTNPARLQ